MCDCIHETSTFFSLNQLCTERVLNILTTVDKPLLLFSYWDYYKFLEELSQVFPLFFGLKM